MGILGNVSLGSVKGFLEGAGALAKDIRSAITGEISPEKKAEIETKIMELEAKAQAAQTDINKIEAQNPNLFVSGWRPFIGWICGLGVFYHFIGYSLIEWGLAVAGSAIKPPALETEGLLSLIFALLGIGGLRTLEKVKGVARG